MRYQISFSGGLGSGISALIAYEKGLDFNLIFADTLIEDEDLYRFNHDIARAVNKEIVWLKDGRTPWDVYVDKRWIGNTRTAHCSTELKSKPVEEWLDKNAEPTDPLVLGMDWSEQDRIERAQEKWDRPVISLLNEYKVSRAEYDLILNRYGIKKPRLYGMGWSHNNCGGFCCKAGLTQFERLYRTMPERYKWHEDQMERAMQEIGESARPFLRQTRSWSDLEQSERSEVMRLQQEQDSSGIDDEGRPNIDNRSKIASLKITYLTLKEFRRQLEAGTMELPMFDAEGCGCFTD